MQPRIILLFFTTLFLIQTVSAKDFDLETILQLAKENNKEIKLARSERKVAAANLKDAISTALPQVNIDVGYNRNFLENIFYFTVTDSSGRPRTQSFKASFRNEYQLNATLNQTIYGFGKVGNAIKAAKIFKNYSQYQYEDQWQKIITRVKKAFYQALLQKKVWEVARQSENSALENYRNMKTKFESGVISEFDLLQAEVRWENSIPETMQARKFYKLAINNLKALVDVPLREQMNLVGSLENFPELPDTLNYREIFSHRPDYNALLLEKQLREKRVAIERSNYLPTLLGNLTYTYGARSDAFRLENDNDNIILGLSLRIPLFTGGHTGAQVQKAKIDMEKVRTRINMANDNIRINLQNIMLRMKEARQRIIAAEKSVGTARRAFEIARSRVEFGLATQLELKDSRVFLDRAQLNYYTAIYDYLDARFDWDLATGNIPTEESSN